MPVCQRLRRAQRSSRASSSSVSRRWGASAWPAVASPRRRMRTLIPVTNVSQPASEGTGTFCDALTQVSGEPASSRFHNVSSASALR